MLALLVTLAACPAPQGEAAPAGHEAVLAWEEADPLVIAGDVAERYGLVLKREGATHEVKLTIQSATPLDRDEAVAALRIAFDRVGYDVELADDTLLVRGRLGYAFDWGTALVLDDDDDERLARAARAMLGPPPNVHVQPDAATNIVVAYTNVRPSTVEVDDGGEIGALRAAAGIESVGPDHVRVPRAAFEALRAELGSQVRFLPYTGPSGQTEGYRLVGIPRDGVLALCGLRTSDVVATFNDAPLVDPAGVAAFLGALLSERHVALEVIRRGRTMPLRLSITGEPLAAPEAWAQPELLFAATVAGASAPVKASCGLLGAFPSGAFRAAPNYLNGQPTGFKVFGLRADGAMSAAGFQNGDVVLGVNGVSFADGDLMDVPLPDDRRCVFAVERGGEALAVEWTVPSGDAAAAVDPE